MNKTMNKSFDKRLQALLTICDLDCQDVAQRLGVAVPVVRRWYNGTSVPDVYQFREIARLFGVPYAWFLDGGDGFPNEKELAERLGLREDTVRELLSLAETKSVVLLGAVDNAIFSVISAVNTAYDGPLDVAVTAPENLK